MKCNLPAKEQLQNTIKTIQVRMKRSTVQIVKKSKQCG